MKKRFKKFMMGCLALAGCFSLASCGFAASETDDLLAIKSITSETLDDKILLTITYNNEDITPLVVEIPTGKDGTDGVGISDIVLTDPTPSEDGSKTYYDIKLSNGDIYHIELANGVGVIGVEQTVDIETGEKYLVFKYSDGTYSNKFLLPKGDKGDDGVGIQDIITQEKEDGSKDLLIYLTTSEGPDDYQYKVTIPAPEKGEKGQDGRGIKGIVATTKGDKYILTISYTDDSKPTEVSFDIPKTNNWYSGTTDPTNSEGEINDLYYNYDKGIIYKKGETGWQKIATLESEEITYSVTFDANGEGAYFDNGFASYTIDTITKGDYFATGKYGTIPTPSRPNYKFTGWCTSTRVSATSGFFTDLTPVMSDLTLYAIWEENK